MNTFPYWLLGIVWSFLCYGKFELEIVLALYSPVGDILVVMNP